MRWDMSIGRLEANHQRFAVDFWGTGKNVFVPAGIDDGITGG